jgi:hypothetical protein
MDKPVKPGQKKPYEVPVLTVHGTVRDLTKNVKGGRNLDGKPGRGGPRFTGV